jgi:hypothetical protein
MKPRKAPLKEKPTTMNEEEWQAHRNRCSIITADRRWRRLASEAYPAVTETAEAAEHVCLSLGGA